MKNDVGGLSEVANLPYKALEIITMDSTSDQMLDKCLSKHGVVIYVALIWMQ